MTTNPTDKNIPEVISDIVMINIELVEISIILKADNIAEINKNFFAFLNLSYILPEIGDMIIPIIRLKLPRRPAIIGLICISSIRNKTIKVNVKLAPV
jgi:hypothetical protein